MLAIRVISFVLLCLMASSASEAKEYSLDNPNVLQSVPTLSKSVDGISFIEGYVAYFTKDSMTYVLQPVNLTQSDPLKRFGTFEESLRLDLPVPRLPGFYRGFLPVASRRPIVWDATLLRLFDFQPATREVVREVTVPTDVVKPPRDSMGEPSRIEIERARARFKSSFKRVFGEKYTGLTRSHAKSGQSSTLKFFLSTKIEGYPLLEMECASSDPMQCLISRYCFLEGGPAIKGDAVAGVGVINNGSLVSLGDSERHAIHLYQYNSCFDVRYVATVKLPTRINRISTHMVDEDGRLWIGTKSWDNFYNSNLYVYEKWLQ